MNEKNKLLDAKEEKKTDEKRITFCSAIFFNQSFRHVNGSDWNLYLKREILEFSIADPIGYWRMAV